MLAKRKRNSEHDVHSWGSLLYNYKASFCHSPATALPLIFREDAKLAKARAKQMVPEIVHLFDQIDVDAWWKDYHLISFCFDVRIVM